jgi:hypothetical protein
MDVKVKDDFYRLRFEVEGLLPLAEDTPTDNGPHDDGDMDVDKPKDDNPDDEDREANRTKHNEVEKKENEDKTVYTQNFGGSKTQNTVMKFGSFEKNPVSNDEHMIWSDNGLKRLEPLLAAAADGVLGEARRSPPPVCMRNMSQNTQSRCTIPR